jgi:hypothetical protein
VERESVPGDRSSTNNAPRIKADEVLKRVRMFRRSENQLNVSTEPQEHSQKPLDRKPLDPARK